MLLLGFQPVQFLTQTELLCYNPGNGEDPRNVQIRLVMDFTFADSVSVCEFFQLFPDEQSAVHFLEEVRWPDGVLCVHCGSDRTKELTAYKLHQCNACHCRRGRRL